MTSLSLFALCFITSQPLISNSYRTEELFGSETQRNYYKCITISEVGSIALKCPPESLIHVIQMHLSRGECAQYQGQPCFHRLTSMDLLVRDCEGQTNCSINLRDSSSPCSGQVDQYNITFQCINKKYILPICPQDDLRTPMDLSKVVMATKTFLDPLSQYIANIRCECTVTPRTGSMKINLNLFYISITNQSDCNNDYLMFNQVKICENRNLLGLEGQQFTQRLMDNLTSVSKIEFLSQRPSRGVWFGISSDDYFSVSCKRAQEFPEKIETSVKPETNPVYREPTGRFSVSTITSGAETTTENHYSKYSGALIGGLVGAGTVLAVVLIVAIAVCIIRRAKKRNFAMGAGSNALYTFSNHHDLVSQKGSKGLGDDSAEQTVEEKAYQVYESLDQYEQVDQSHKYASLDRLKSERMVQNRPLPVPPAEIDSAYFEPLPTNVEHPTLSSSGQTSSNAIKYIPSTRYLTPNDGYLIPNSTSSSQQKPPSVPASQIDSSYFEPLPAETTKDSSASAYSGYIRPNNDYLHPNSG